MIVKKVRREIVDKPKTWQIGDLVDYIRFPHNKNPQEKVAHAGSRNFLTSTHNGQKMEMIALAEESVHSKMPVQHWIFSWQEGEQPTREQVDEAVDIFLGHMGLTGHQTVYALHYDTDNYHLHIAVNRMNEETGKVVQPHKGFDIDAAHRILALIEHGQGWKPQEKARYVVLENGELARRKSGREIKPRQAALDVEHATGEKSAQRIAQERGHDIIRDADSWEDMHRKLAEVGLRFEKKGSGAVIFVGDIAVKASSVDRAFSMKKLCRKWGEFTEGNYTKEQEALPPEPVSSVNLEEWKLYQQEFEEEEKEARNDEAITPVDFLRKRQREQRRKSLARLAQYGVPVLNIARHCLKIQQREERRFLRGTGKKVRRHKPRFEAWLRAKGLHRQAGLWRYRSAWEKTRHTPPPVPDRGREFMREMENFRRYAAAVGADRYRVTCIAMETNGNKKTFILDKEGGVTRGFTPEELVLRIPEMLRLQRRGENIYYTPLSEEKHHVLIDDMTAESLVRLQRDGYRPAVILESSPGNFQCLLTIAKLGSRFDRDVGNRLTERLNREYGDKKLCGCIHPHRAPGFENRKPKHRREDGSFPEVKLLVAEKRECRKALELARQIAGEYEAAAENRKRWPVLPPGCGPSGDAVTAYHAHLEDIRRHLTIEDYSRVDAMIALRLRATGHSRDAVMDAVRQCAPAIRETPARRDWQRYAERTADYAFGTAGDVELAKYETYRELWRRVEERAGMQQKYAIHTRME